MIKIILEVEEKEKNTQVKMKNENFDKGSKNEQMSALQIIGHIRKLFEEVNAEKKEEPKKKTTRKTTKKKKEEN